MDKLVSKRVKSNVMNIDQNNNIEKKIANKRKGNMNKKKNILLNQPKNDEVIMKKNMKKVKNEKICKNGKDNIEETSTHLINRRRKDNHIKEAIYKDLEKEKKFASSTKGTSIKSSGLLDLNKEEHVEKGMVDNKSVITRTSSNYSILNYFKNSKDTNKSGMTNNNNNNNNINNINNNNNIVKTSSGSNKTRNISNNRNNIHNKPNGYNLKRDNIKITNYMKQSDRHIEKNNEVHLDKHGYKDDNYKKTFNHNNYLSMKNNIENNLMNYKKCKLDRIHAENNSSIDSFQSKDDKNVIIENKDTYKNKEYMINKDVVNLTEHKNDSYDMVCNRLGTSCNVLNTISLSQKNNDNINLNACNNSLVIKGEERKSRCTGQNRASSVGLLKRNSIYNYKENLRDDLINNCVEMENMDTTKNINNMKNLDCVSNINYVNNINNNVNINKGLINSSQEINNSCKNIEYELNDLNKEEENNNFLYNFKERNTEYLHSINIPYTSNSNNNINKNHLMTSLPTEYRNKSSKSSDELFSRNLLDFENFCSYKFKRNINNNLVNNICNMYEEVNDLDVYPEQMKRGEGSVSYGDNNMCNNRNGYENNIYNTIKRNSYFFHPYKDDHFEGEKLFKKPRICVYNVINNGNKYDNNNLSVSHYDDVEKRRRVNLGSSGNMDLHYHHSDLLINKREKVIINEDVNNKEIMKGYIKNFWYLSKKIFFGKYKNCAVSLENEEVERLKEIISFDEKKGKYTLEDLFGWEERKNFERKKEEKKDTHGGNKMGNYGDKNWEDNYCKSEYYNNNNNNNDDDDAYDDNDDDSTLLDEGMKDICDDETISEKDYVTDKKLKNFRLDLIDGFLYDKQSLYEREMIENEKIFSMISFNHKNYDIHIEKLLNLFPRDFMKKYKIVKKLGEGVYGKVFKAESLDDCYLHFAVKVLRYFWPNFKYKFGSEEFAVNEYNIMRILFHPNVVCLIDSFRVHTYRKGKTKNHRNNKGMINDEDSAAEYDFSFQRHRKPERNQYSPSLETVQRNNRYSNFVAKNCITIEDLEKDLVMHSIDKPENVEQNFSSYRDGHVYNNDITMGGMYKKGVKKGEHDSKKVLLYMGGTNNVMDKCNIRKDSDDVYCNYDYFKGNAAVTNDNNKNDDDNNKNDNDNNKGGGDNNKNGDGGDDGGDDVRGVGKISRGVHNYAYKSSCRKKMRKGHVRIKENTRTIDKLKYRKHSKKLKKIENKNNDYIENWDLFLVIEKCDCSLNDILNKVKKKHSLFIQHIKQCTAQYLPNERIDMTYDHIRNYVKYVYLPLKKIENRSFYPEMPSLTEIQTKVVIYQMLQGINHFHKKFIIHRDIKPANTLIKNIQYLSDGLNDPKEWIVKIADFGLGVYDHFLKAETKDSNIITLQYRPPEILCNSTLYNYSVDIWSVGITMCECLLGFVPVTSKFESSVLFKILVFRGIPNENFDDLLKKEFIGELPKFKIDRLKMLQIIFTDIYGRRILSDEGLDLIDQFLSYDYKNRITANEALKHKWFEDVHLHLNEDLLRYYKDNGTYYF
ncbi:CMGC/CDK protein kinase [Plasmodium falciparum NF54]|uniref:non-specific serine/threonine protein kinase n=1 Tax=Plasmodium falciparum (isolate NF54) TaxID=5843 RepID=W7KCB8_PLAFO|nr:CMGC/CDK protein kinase [Plasmodium falciparum NF54]